MVNISKFYIRFDLICIHHLGLIPAERILLDRAGNSRGSVVMNDYSTRPGALIEAATRSRVGVRWALLGLVVGASLLIALLIHLSWQRTADRNVRALVDQLEARIVASVSDELSTILQNALAAQEAIRSIFFQDVISTTDEAKREFIFLAQLQSQPSLSWIAFGWPTGDFFGAYKIGDQKIEMIEVHREADGQPAQLRIDHYDVVTGDIMFREREIRETDYRADQQSWYQRAVAANGPVWTEQRAMPTTTQPAIATSTPLSVYQQFIGVINVTIELDRLSAFLSRLQVGRTGAAYILAPDGRVLAAPHSRPGASAGDWRSFAQADDPYLRAAAGAVRASGLDIGALPATALRLDFEAPDDHRYFVGLSPLPFERWLVVTVIPASDFLADIEASVRQMMMMVAFLVVVVAAGAAFMADRLITRPLGRVAGQLRRIEQFELDRIERIPSPLRELDDLSTAMGQMGRGLSSFRKYLPADLVRILVGQGIEARPGGTPRDLTVMFTDLAGFTRLSEQSGEAIVPLLAEHLGEVSQAIHQTGGTVDKFIGDAVMAFWNAPLTVADHAAAACRAALAAQRVVKAQGNGLTMRVGINTGTVLVGNIGSNERLNYTAIGDPVNLASRLEALNKRYGTDIIVGETTRRSAGGAIIVRQLDTVAVYGKREGVAIFELLGMSADGPAPDWVAVYEAGLFAYRNRDWASAIARFAAVIAARGTDQPSDLLMARCRRYAAAPPPPDWDGIDILAEK